MADDPKLARQKSLQTLMWLGAASHQATADASEAAAPPETVKAPPPPPMRDSIATQSKALAETIVDAFTARLKAEARKRGGQLTIADIERLAESFEGKRAQLEDVFRMTFEQYVRARERAAFDHARQYPFDRLIVNTFAELFAAERQKADGADRVTRKVLPGFFLAIDKMIGPEKIEAFQERCRAVVDRLADGEEQFMDWQALYDDAEAKELCIDALVTFAPYFDSLERRCNWFLHLVNENLQGDDWQLTEQGFYTLTLTMFSVLRRELLDREGRIRMEKRYGMPACQKLHREMEILRKAILERS